MQELIINSTVQYTLLLLIPLVFALVLKMAKLRGWSMIGGVIGGILLGPAVFGSIAPDYWEGIFRGGELEHTQLVQLERQQHADVIAATSVGSNEIVLKQMQEEHHVNRTAAHNRWEEAKWNDQRTIRDYAIALVVLILLSGSLRCNTKGTSTPMMSLSVGVWAAIVPGGCIAVIAYWLWDTQIIMAIALGACLGVGPWTLTKWEQRTADQSEESGSVLMLRCGRVAWIVASIAGIYAAWHIRGAMALVWLLPLLLVPCIWLIPPKKLRWLSVFVEYAAIPSVMATGLVLINPFESLQFWPILVVILLCADARWLGGMIGLGILGGRTISNAMRLSIPLVDAGVSQLCVAVLLWNVGVLTAPYAVAIIIGALFLELTSPMRFKFAMKH